MRDPQPIQRHRSDYLLVVLLVLPALYPLLGAGIFRSYDGLHYLFRLFELDYTLRGGGIFPLWLPHAGLGYGYPAFIMEGPLTYYLALPFVALGSGMIVAIKILYALGFVGAALGMYLLSRPFVGRAGALLSALIYTYVPYHLSLAYIQGALPELLAFAALPFILRALHRAIQEGSAGCAALFGLGMAALFLTSRVSTILVAPLVVAFGLAIAFSSRQWRPLLSVGAAILVVICGTAFYWLPARHERAAVYLGRGAYLEESAASRLASLRDVVSPHLVHRYMPDAGWPPPYPVGLAAGVVALLALVPVLFRWRRLMPVQRAWIGSCGLLAVGGMAMMLELSAPLWYVIPGLERLQHPWHWQLLTSIGIAGMAGGWAMTPLSPTTWRTADQPDLIHWVVALIVSVAVATTGLARLPMVQQEGAGQGEVMTEGALSLAGLARYEASLLAGPGQGQGESSPKLASIGMTAASREHLLALASAEALPSQDGPTEPAIRSLQVVKWAPLRLHLRVRAERATPLRLHITDFPGWAARIDGDPVDLYPSTPLRLLTLDVPAGEHDVMVFFGMTPVRWLGLALSGLAALGAAVWLFVSRRRKILGAIVMAAIVLGGVWTWHSQPGVVAAPEPRWVELGDEIAVSSYEVSWTQLPGSSLSVDLWWLSLSPPSEPYVVSLRLEDSTGRSWLDYAAQPAYGHPPTTHWAQNELVWDHHELRLPPDMPAGEYLLYLSLRRAETGTDLAPSGGNAGPEETRLLLTTVDLEHP